jgi:hypothetical protein
VASVEGAIVWSFKLRLICAVIRETVIIATREVHPAWPFVWTMPCDVIASSSTGVGSPISQSSSLINNGRPVSNEMILSQLYTDHQTRRLISASNEFSASRDV